MRVCSKSCDLQLATRHVAVVNLGQLQSMQEWGNWAGYVAVQLPAVHACCCCGQPVHWQAATAKNHLPTVDMAGSRRALDTSIRSGCNGHKPGWGGRVRSHMAFNTCSCSGCPGHEPRRGSRAGSPRGLNTRSHCSPELVYVKAQLLCVILCQQRNNEPRRSQTSHLGLQQNAAAHSIFVSNQSLVVWCTRDAGGLLHCTMRNTYVHCVAVTSPTG